MITGFQKIQDIPNLGKQVTLVLRKAAISLHFLR